MIRLNDRKHSALLEIKHSAVWGENLSVTYVYGVMYKRNVLFTKYNYY